MTNDAPTTPPTAAPPRGALLTVFLVVVIDLLGFAIVLPLLPRIAETYLEGRSKFVTGLTIGLLFSSFSLMQFIFAPLWGRLSDRIGRRPVLLVGLAGSVVFYTVFGYGATVDPAQSALAITLMFVARIGAGIAGATISTAAAVIADCTPPDQRKRGMALIGAAFGVGFTFGPLIAFGAVKQFPAQGHGAVGYVAAGLSFIALVLGMALLPETRVAGRLSERRGWLNFHQLAETLRTPTVGLLVASYFLATFGFANFESTLSLLTKAAFGFTDDENFLVFAYVGFVLVFVQGGVYRPIAHRLSEVAFIRLGVLFMLLGLGGLAVLSAVMTMGGTSGRGPLVVFLAVMAVAVTGFAFLNPSVSALISRRSDPTRQGEVLGVNQSANALARILGPLIGLMLFPLTATHVLPYVMASALLLIVLVLTPRLRAEPEPHPASGVA
ncbi:MAG TPA: MFS transporter [Gemmataceae bacterium]|jgi:MFS family permease